MTADDGIDPKYLPSNKSADCQFMKKNSPPAMTRHSCQTGSGRALLSRLENKAYWSGRSESRRPLALELDIEPARTWSSFTPYPLHGAIRSLAASPPQPYAAWKRLSSFGHYRFQSPRQTEEVIMGRASEAPIRRTIRRQQLREMVPLADSTIYEMEQRNEFPRRFALSPRCVVWDLAEVEAWLASRRSTANSARSASGRRSASTRPVKAKDRAPAAASTAE